MDSLGKWLARAGFFIGLSLPVGQVFAQVAQGYNIILKNVDSTTTFSCATGGFSFTKPTSGTFPAGGQNFPISGAQVTLPTNCIPLVPNGTFNVSNALNVVVQNITTNKPGTGGQIEPLFQGPNVEGLRGNLQFTTSTLGNCQGVGTTLQAKVYRIIFLYSDTDGTPTPQERTYSITCSTPASAPTTVATGRYHVFNPLSTVPEPETLLLFLTTLGGLGLALHLSGRRRAKRPR